MNHAGWLPRWVACICICWRHKCSGEINGVMVYNFFSLSSALPKHSCYECSSYFMLRDADDYDALLLPYSWCGKHAYIIFSKWRIWYLRENNNFLFFNEFLLHTQNCIHENFFLKRHTLRSFFLKRKVIFKSPLKIILIRLNTNFFPYLIFRLCTFNNKKLTTCQTIPRKVYIFFFRKPWQTLSTLL